MSLMQLQTLERNDLVSSASLYDLGELKTGNLEVIVARHQDDIHAAQELRYRVFFEEMGAPITEELARTRADIDIFDSVCDHLLVIEHQEYGGYKVVGTYRLIRRSAMERIGRFYTEGEYDISAIKYYKGEVLEVGRSCVDPLYRNRSVMQLLWRGIGAYIAKFNIEIMFGCASFHGTNPELHKLPLAYLYHYHLAPVDIRPIALEDRYVEMNGMPKEEVNVKEAFNLLPALIKGYLRLGGYVGAGAVIDHECNTTDVSIIVKTDLLTEKYVQRYSKDLQAKDQ